ncbi:hypothetical protein BDV06DRAFT_220846 [Aspergillus oleicola]
MPPKTTDHTDGNTDSPSQQDVQFGFECLRNIKDGKVDLAGVMAALNYKNINSVGNRFRAMKKAYGFTGLDCTTANAPSPAKRKATAAADADGDGATPTKRGPGRPSKKVREKAAKAQTQAAVGDDDGYGDDYEMSKVNFQVEVMKSQEE